MGVSINSTTLTCTLDEFVASRPSNKMSYYTLSLLETDHEHNITYDVYNVISDYLQDLKKMSTVVTLTDDEYYIYRFRPKLLANYLYGNGELYFIILMLNDIWTIKDFDFKKVRLISKSDLSNALSNINASEKNFISKYNEYAKESY